MALEARRMKITLPPDLAIDAEVDLNNGSDGYFLRARLNIGLPGLDRATAQKLVDAAHQTCPYSKATHGNVDVTLNLV
jgi:Ohr subfamily peroxiredoxin